MEAAAPTAAVAVAVARRKEMQAAAARAAVKRKTFLELVAGGQPSCLLLAAKTLK